MPITQFDPKPVTVVDNLTTNDSNKALSAAQGKYLYDNRYVHPTTSGNKHIPSGGSANQWLKYSADGTAAWAALPTASTSQAGIVQLSSSLTSSSETVAATSKAVQKLNNNFEDNFICRSYIDPETDTDLISNSFKPGIYMIARSPKNPYLPTGYGILIKFSTTQAYKGFLVFGTDGSLWIRHCNDTEWHIGWTKIH